MWVCVADKTNPAELTGLSMGPLAVQDFEDYYAHYTFEKYYAGMSPCDTAFDWADLYVALDAPEESISQRLLNSTFACRSVDEWWTSLQNYPEVFGVVSLPDEDMWSYLAAVCPSGTPSRVCEEAVADGLLQH